METNSNIIKNALLTSVRANNNHQLNEATSIINQESIKKRYITSLVQIINQDENPIDITLAALAQLKNFIRKRWICSQYCRSKQEEIMIDEGDRQYLIKNIFSTNQRFSQNHKFAIIIKDILQIIGKSVLFLFDDVICMISEGRQLKTCLNFILGIAGCFRFQNDVKMQRQYFKILEKLVPALTQLVHKGQQNILNMYYELDNLYKINALTHQIQTKNKFYQEQQKFFSQIICMSIKFIFKTISTQFPIQLRKACCEWAIIALHTLQRIDSTFDRMAAEQPEENGKRGTQKFFYFHSKKWSAKYLTKFIQKIMIYKKSDKEITNITLMFYTVNEQLLIETLQTMFNHPQTKKVRFYQLEFLTRMFSLKPKIMEPYIDHYQFIILPQFLKFRKQDYETAKEKPLDFLINQSPHRVHQIQNTKMLATKLWMSLAKIDTQQNPNKGLALKEGKQLIKSVQQIKKYILSNNEQKLHIGLYLMIQMSTKVSQYKQSNKIMTDLLNILIPEIYEQGDFILMVRGYELIYSMGIYLEKSKYSHIFNLIIGIFLKRNDFLDIENQQFSQIHRSQDNYEQYQKILDEKKKYQILGITSAMAFGKILQIAPRQALPLKPHELPIILRNITGLIQTYQIEQIAQTLIILVQYYPDQIDEYANIIICQVSRVIKEIMQKQSKGQSSYQAGLMVNSYVDVLMSFSSMICTKQNNKEIRDLLQKQIVSLLEELFQYQAAQGFYFYENILNLLIRYLSDNAHNPAGISQDLLFFYRFFIFKLSFLSRRKLQQIQFLNCSSVQKALLFKCQQADEFNPQLTYQLFKNYFKYINTQNIKIETKHIVQNTLTCNELELFFFMITFYYQKAKPNITEQMYYLQNYKGRYLSTILLPCLIQFHRNNLHQTVYQKIFQILIANIKTQILIKHFRKHNIQLFCVWLYGYNNALIALNDMKSRFGTLFSILFLSQQAHLLQEFTSDLQRKRIIYGLSTLMIFGLHNVQIYPRLNTIVYWIFYLIRQQIKIQIEGPFINEYNQTEVYNYMQQQTNICLNQEKQDQTTGFDPNEPNTVIQIKMDESKGRRKKSLDSYIEDGLRQNFIEQQQDYGENNVYQYQEDEILFFLNKLLQFKQYNLECYLQIILYHYQEIIEDLLKVLTLQKDPQYLNLLENPYQHQYNP